MAEALRGPADHAGPAGRRVRGGLRRGGRRAARGRVRERHGGAARRRGGRRPGSRRRDAHDAAELRRLVELRAVRGGAPALRRRRPAPRTSTPRRRSRAASPTVSRAVLPVSLAGLPVDLEPLQPLRDRGVIVIEDGCHALGGRAPGRARGRRRPRRHDDLLAAPGQGHDDGRGRRRHDDRRRRSPTRCARSARTACAAAATPTTCCSAAGTTTSTGSASTTASRTSSAPSAAASCATSRTGWSGATRSPRATTSCSATSTGLRLPARARDGEVHGYHLFVVRFTEGAARRRFMFDRLREAGIGTQLHYIPIPLHGLYRDLGYGPEAMGALPEAQALLRAGAVAADLPGHDATRTSTASRPRSAGC